MVNVLLGFVNLIYLWYRPLRPDEIAAAFSEPLLSGLLIRP